MAGDDGKRLVERHLDLSWNLGDCDALDEVWAADAVVHLPGVTIDGLPALKSHLRSQVGAYGDRRIDVLDLVTKGDTVAARWSFEGVQTGEVLGTAPTNRRVEITGMDFYRVSGGKLAEEWIEGNFLGLMYQLGALP